MTQILVVNPGSSSLKLRILAADDAVVLQRDIEYDQGSLDVSALAEILQEEPPYDAAGVRFVHAGDIRSPAIVDDGLVDRLAAATDLAPVHNSQSLGAINLLRRARPDRPIVACFDTEFHASMPDAAALYAIPWQWIETWGIRRYGFHGLSHQYAAGRAAQLTGRTLAEMRVVTCHLGAGASLAAVRGGESVDTTMGFTPLDGLVMATRSGSVDPGALLWLQRRAGLTADAIERALEREAGILGLSGVSGDMRQVLVAAGSGNGRARLAIDVYLHRLRAGIAAMAASMEGLDLLVFTGGVGEGSAEVRAAVARGLAFLGVAVDYTRNQALPCDADTDISEPGASVGTLVVHAREDLAIAAEVRRVLAASEPG